LDDRSDAVFECFWKEDYRGEELDLATQFSDHRALPSSASCDSHSESLQRLNPCSLGGGFRLLLSELLERLHEPKPVTEIIPARAA
jgi:hypothetical protein